MTAKKDTDGQTWSHFPQKSEGHISLQNTIILGVQGVTSGRSKWLFVSSFASWEGNAGKRARGRHD